MKGHTTLARAGRLLPAFAASIALAAGCARSEAPKPAATTGSGGMGKPSLPMRATADPGAAPAGGTGKPSSPMQATADPAAAPPTPPTAPQPPAEIRFDHDTHDFGLVSDVRPVTHNYPFTNSGKGPLTIANVTTSCGCTAAKASKTELAPGESAMLEVTYTPRGYGEHSYRVSVTSNAETSPTTHVQFHAEVDPFVAVEPRQVDFGTVGLNQPHTAYVTLACRDGGMTLTNVNLRADHLTAAISTKSEVGADVSAERPGRAVIEVNLDSSAPWGEVRGTVIATAKATPEGAHEPIEHVVYIPVSALVFGDVHADPSSFHLGVIAPGASFSEAVILKSPSGKPFQILSAAIEEANASGISVKVEPVAGAEVPSYTLTVGGSLGQHSGPVHGNVAFRTDIPGMPEKCLIRFSGIVR